VQNEDTDDWFGRRMEAVMCALLFLLLELSGVPVCDSPQAFGKRKKPK
jgi:hypothetical protein